MKPNMVITVEYGEFNFTFTADPKREFSHAFVTCNHGHDVLVNRMIEVGAPKKGLDFYLSGIEVFCKQAVTDLLKQSGTIA